MMGGAWFEEMFGDQDTVDIGQFAGIAVEAIGQQLGITEDPIKTETFLQKVSLKLMFILMAVNE